MNGSTVTVPGTFTYTSAAGTRARRRQRPDEAVTFTPTDTTDYTTASATATDQRRPGHADGHHLVQSREHHLRHGPGQRSSTPPDRNGARHGSRHVHLHASRRDGPRRWQPDDCRSPSRPPTRPITRRPPRRPRSTSWASSPTSVYVASAYAGDAPGTAVTWTDGSTHSVGFDAFGTIQAGINAVAAGGTVNIASGTYTEQLTIASEPEPAWRGGFLHHDPGPGEPERQRDRDRQRGHRHDVRLERGRRQHLDRHRRQRWGSLGQWPGRHRLQRRRLGRERRRRHDHRQHDQWLDHRHPGGLGLERHLAP